jgi:hypothetical protein
MFGVLIVPSSMLYSNKDFFALGHPTLLSFHVVLAYKQSFPPLTLKRWGWGWGNGMAEGRKILGLLTIN